MNRREWLKKMGMGSGAVVAAPVLGPGIWEKITKYFSTLFRPEPTFPQIALPLVRRVFPALTAQQLVSVQPMTPPSALVFFMDFKYADPGHPKRLETVWRAHQAAKSQPLCNCVRDYIGKLPERAA